MEQVNKQPVQQDIANGRDEVYYKWVKASDELPKGENDKSISIKYKGSSELIVYLDGNWYWRSDSFYDSRKYPVRIDSWSVIEWLKPVESLPIEENVILKKQLESQKDEIQTLSEYIQNIKHELDKRR